MAAARFSSPELRKPVGSPRPKGRGMWGLGGVRAVGANNKLIWRVQKMRRIPYAGMSWSMAIADMKIKAVLSTMNLIRRSRRNQNRKCFPPLTFLRLVPLDWIYGPYWLPRLHGHTGSLGIPGGQPKGMMEDGEILEQASVCLESWLAMLGIFSPISCASSCILEYTQPVSVWSQLARVLRSLGGDHVYYPCAFVAASTIMLDPAFLWEQEACRCVHDVSIRANSLDGGSRGCYRTNYRKVCFRRETWKSVKAIS